MSEPFLYIHEDPPEEDDTNEFLSVPKHVLEVLEPPIDEENDTVPAEGFLELSFDDLELVSKFLDVVENAAEFALARGLTNRNKQQGNWENYFIEFCKEVVAPNPDRYFSDFLINYGVNREKYFLSTSRVREKLLQTIKDEFAKKYPGKSVSPAEESNALYSFMEVMKRSIFDRNRFE
jgi:hypothetical protein